MTRKKSSISNEKRQLIWENFNAGKNVRELVNIFSVKSSTIYAIIKKILMINVIKKESRARKNITRKMSKPIINAIYNLVDENNAITLSQIKKHLT